MRRRRRRRRRILVGGAVLIGGGALVYKLSKQDAQKIEEYSGIPPEEMEDADLQEAMKDLNIQSQELTAEDKTALNQADAAEQQAGDEAAAAAVSAASAEPAQDDYIEQLKQLAALKDAGILTEEEFEAKKKQILGL
jgi:predicted mannosyl-3-phosphoglycerate phosphatase (HAD superfamily)